MTRRCNYLSLVFLIFSTALSWSQRTGSAHPVEVHGRIVLPNGRPAPVGTIVTLESPGGGFNGQAQTDTQGKFSFPQMTPAIYELHVHAFGYLPESQTVDLTISPSAFVNFTLKPDPSNKENPIPPGGPGATISAPLDPNAPDDARKDFEDGRNFLSSGKDLDKSIGLFQKAIQRYPQYSEAYLLMGIAYSSQKKWDDAERALKKTIEINKSAAGAYVALGSVENERKEYSEAEKYLLKAVELSPNSADAHFELGRAYWGLQRWDLADQHVSKANQLRPDSAGQHVMLGNIMLRERDAMGALKEFKQAVQVDPTGPLAAPAKQMVDKIEAALKQAEAQKK
ncbi:MAG TPA: tetratricopeptide repeat protein [Terriglobales bacterium]|nr:tetratricopeptide repeat protein [Terriglobales bacterium]